MVKRDLIRNLLILVIAIFIFVALRLLVFTPYTIKSQDSNHYLAENDFVLAIRGEKIQREDFVLYEVDGKEYVGRVIAKGNDAFIYMDDVLYLNNKIKTENYLSSLKEKYLATPGNSGYFTHDFSLQTLTDSKTRKIPKDSYLILNDNRQNTRDSREFGLITSKQIQGVISFRISPLKDRMMVSHTSPLSWTGFSVGSMTAATSSNSSNSITSLSLRLQQIHLHLFYAAQLGLIFFGFTDIASPLSYSLPNYSLARPPKVSC